MPTILTVDDEPGIRSFLADCLSANGAEILEAGDGEEALRMLEDRPVDLLLLDLRMPGGQDGMAVLRRARAQWPETQVVVLTAYGTVSEAVEAMRLGAFDFLEKPLDGPETVRRMARRALNWRARSAADRVAALSGEQRAQEDDRAPTRPSLSRVRAFLGELRRRHVYQVAATYIAMVLAVLQIGQLVLPVLPFPGWSYAALVALSVAGVPVVLVLGWVYDVRLTRTGRVPVSGEG